MHQDALMDPLDALDQSAELWSTALSVLPDDLDVPSYLPKWSVRDLVNHVAGGGVRYAMYLDGKTSQDAEPTRYADYCTPDAFADSQAALRERLADRDRWTETVVHPAGPLSVLDSLHRRCIELVVHSWDIAKSFDLTGVEVCPMSKELATYLSGVYAATNAGLAGSSYFASEPDGPAEDPRAKLLRLSGRVA